ncbi:IS110 family RNA-guided transposase [Paraburkholderia kirstenboschensis]|uniref:IS110 family transposase n=1 Tax=Paraburkholderia kirstenboschensis TaxID=1245436 RepID=A0ABZ0ECK1_9BURK|nr:IS110 family transposase [Paraburkholderia kirstenboschensis]WOD14199.1 IS110 family transposase [Paraburkholderia kirstenboschensis]WOD14292.1 IS110 family transposase [Paraburkholderia kirstenboschensis]WOD16679.1 IS110 family transposase [Paraburkholderia kirstenboschensis]
MRTDQTFTTGSEEQLLAVSLELAAANWKVALHDGRRDKPAVHTVAQPQAAARLQAVLALIEGHREKWSLPAGVRIVVSYEAGQDAFWICRALQAHGIECYVVDPASIPVERHRRRAKTDRLDAIKLVINLRAWLRGERDRMHVVHVPSPQDEASRHLMRDRGQLQKEVLQHHDRMRKLLVTVGCWHNVDHKAFAGQLACGQVMCHDGAPLPPELRERLLRECERLALVEQQLAVLEKTRQASLPSPARERIDQLARLKAIGPVGASRLALELFWREFTNRRQVGACVGLVPQPYNSGESQVDQGISRQGNRRVRALLVEIAWCWLRYQPDSALTQWFNQRTQGTGPNRRARRIAIVAVARRLAIALWRYLKDGVIPDGAQLKST